MTYKSIVDRLYMSIDNRQNAQTGIIMAAGKVFAGLGISINQEQESMP